MFETPFHIVGNIVTDPIHRRVGDQQVIKFRVASNARRRTDAGEWETSNSLFVNVNCWGRLVNGVAALIKGDPVVVVGHVHTSEYDDREGNRRSSIEVRAIAVGPDLSRSTVRIDQPKRLGEPTDSTAGDAGAISAGDEEEGMGDGEGEAELDDPLPLTA